MGELIMACWARQHKILKMQTKTMVLTSAALLLEVITKVLRLILSQMINRKQLSRSLKLKSLNLFQTQYS
jgi:hypothetical protein